MKNINNILYAAVALFTAGCESLVEIDPPLTSLNGGIVWQADNTAVAAVTGIHAALSNAGTSTAGLAGNSGLGVLCGLSADELTLHGTVADNRLIAYYRNALVAGPQQQFGADLWTGSGASGFYGHVFNVNTAIAGLEGSTGLTAAVKQQLLGEAYFLRGYLYQYLLGLFGNIPLVLGTDPKANAVLPQAPAADVQARIIADLEQAKTLLGAVYLDGTLRPYTGSAERVRPTKWAATAMLARAYLYDGQYAKAGDAAAEVIAHAALFGLPALDDAFLKGSTETIWSLQPVRTNRNTEDGYVFNLPATGPTASANLQPVYLSVQQLEAFAPGDARRYGRHWVDSVTALGTTYHFPYKYKAVNANGAPTEYQVLLRLGEQYLIRAEARAQLGDTDGARADLAAIRQRAGLGPVEASTREALLEAILRERQCELFTEQGHRWLDLKRTGKVDAVMSVVTPLKGGTWHTDWQRYPIPFVDLQRNPNLKQNRGY